MKYLGYFKNKVYNLLDYININIDRYDHHPTSVAYNPDEPLAYYLDQKHRANYSGPFDKAGIPLYNYKGKLAYMPIFIFTYALGHFDRYIQDGQQKNLDVFQDIIKWIEANQDENGTWLTAVPVKKFGLAAGWPSAMGQGLAISCLTRAFAVFKKEKYLDIARKALISFMLDFKKGGVVSYEGKWVFYDEYPSLVVNHVLNGFIFSLWGLRDLANIDKQCKAKTLFDDGLNTLIEWLPEYDMDYWSLYHISSQGMKNLASIPYHRLHIQQLKVMHSITGHEIFGEYSKRWEGYLQKRFNALCTLPRKVLWNIMHGL